MAIGNLVIGPNNNTGLYNQTGVPIPQNQNLNVPGNITAGGFITANGNITTNGFFIGDGSLLTNLAIETNKIFFGSSNVSIPDADGPVYANIAGVPTVLIDADGIATLGTNGNIQGPNVVQANTFVGSGNLLDMTGFSGHIIPLNNAVYTLGNVDNQWAELWVAGNTIYLGNVALSMEGNTLQVNGSNVFASGNGVQDGNLYLSGTISANTFIGNINGNSIIGEVAVANTVSNPNQPNITALGTITSLTADAVTINGQLTANGNAQFNGDVYFAANVDIAGNINQISGNSGQFFGNAATGFNALYAGVPAGYNLLQQEVTQFSSNFDGYAQVNARNINGGQQATTDYVITADDGTDSTNYIDMGIAGSGYNGLLANNSLGNSLFATDGYLYTQGNVTGGNLVLGTIQPGAQVRIITGASDLANVRATFNDTGLAVNGNVSANFFTGNGSQLTGIVAAGGASINNGTSNVTIPTANGNIQFNLANVPYGALRTNGAVGFGNNSQQTTVSANAIALGTQAGRISQGVGAIAIGVQAGNNSQSAQSVAIGVQAGNNAQGTNSVAIGTQSGVSAQSTLAVAVGSQSGSTAQGIGSVAVGNGAGQTSQTAGAVAIGSAAGRVTQGSQAVAVGQFAGDTTQGGSAVAMGYAAAQTNQATNAVALGRFAGRTNQGANAIAIGHNAGQGTQGANSIAIGAGAAESSQTAKSIVINASGAALNANTAGLYVDPVRADANNLSNIVYYNAVSKELTYAPLNYSNANVFSYLGSNSNVVITTTGDITANVYYGNGSQLTGMYANANVSDYLASGADTQGIITSGNVNGQFFNGNGSALTGVTATTLDGLSSNVSAVANTIPVRDANASITANTFIGSGSTLTDINAANITGLYGNIDVASGSNINLAEGAVIYSIPTGGLAGTAEVNGADNRGISVTAGGNVAGSSYAQIQWVDDITNYDPFGYANAITNWVYVQNDGIYFETIDDRNSPGYYHSMVLDTDGLLTVPGEISGGGNIDIGTNNFIGNGALLTGLPATYSNADVSTYLASGTNTSNIITTGNISASYYAGNGSQLTGIINVIPAVYLTAPITANNQSFSNVILGAYAANTDITLFYNGSLLPSDYYTLSGDVLTINTPMFVGDTIDIPQVNVGNVTSTVTTGYGNSNVASFLSSPGVGNIVGTGLLIDGSAIITGNANVQGTLTYNDTTNITTSNLVLGLGNTQSGINVTGGGIVVGNTAEASLLYNFSTQSWVSNIGITSNANITGANVNAVGVNATSTIVVGNIANAGTKTRITSFGPNTFIQTGNGVQFSTGNVIFAPYSDANVRVRIDTSTGDIYAAGNIYDQNGQVTQANPAFSATSSVDLTITTAYEPTQVAYNTELLDTNGWFASNRFTPQRAGWYQINCGARLFAPGGGTAEAGLLLRKNGNQIAGDGSIGAVTGSASQLVYFNGTTDFVDVAIFSSLTGTVTQAGAYTYFSGSYVRP